MVPFENKQPVSMTQFQDRMCNIVYNVCSIISMPVETALRPWYGSRYFPPLIIFCSSMMMIVVPVFLDMAGALTSLLPGGRMALPRGMFGLSDLSRFFFLGALVHGIRVWRRMIRPETEQISTFEGPPLPFFYLIPKATSFWFCRIVLEPAFLFVASVVLSTLYILQPSAAFYLQLAAIALAMKQYVAWYQQWQYIREVMDTRFVAPILAKLAENKATDAELANAHLAAFPKDLSPDLRRGTVAHLARIFSPEANAPQASEPDQQNSTETR